jgi:hypothetical protein
MSRAEIDYVQPVTLAMDRTRRILFQPFDIAKWFALGFTAWLAQLLEGGGGSVSYQQNFDDSGGNVSFNGWEDFKLRAEQALDGLGDQLSWIIPVAIVLVLLALAVGVALLWLSSRGKFMFLDNVVHNRAMVKQPWHQFRTQGQSLFWWRLTFSILVGFVFLTITGVAGFFLIPSFDVNNFRPEWIAGVVAGLTALVFSGMALTYVSFLLNAFVVPIMFKHSLSATAAWGRVIALHGERPGAIILYALLRLALAIASVILVFLLVIFTCCIGGIIFAIPYLGTIALLPMYVFFQSLSLEFLRQFGPEFDVWERFEGDPVSPPSLPS